MNRRNCCNLRHTQLVQESWRRVCMMVYLHDTPCKQMCGKHMCVCLLCLQGQPYAFEYASSSCLDSVLVDKTGLPISLAVLHRAVGRRCGLDLQLVNMPGQVLNRAVLEGGGEVYVDVFAGQLLQEEGLRWGCLGL